MTSKKRPRSNALIVSQILELCLDGASKTKILHRANLNFMTTKSYLDNLENKGCIEAIPKDSKFIYRTTPKGIDLKERIEQFSASIYDYNLQSIERPNRRDCHRMHLGKNDK